MSITEIFEHKCNDNSDICQHMETLRKYTEGCNIVVELGVRSIVATWAFLAGKPKMLISVDIHHPSYYKEYDPQGCDLELVERLSKEQGINFRFIQENSLRVTLPESDLIFFDTLHTYYQLLQELSLHGNRASKYLIFHDTETYKKELMPAIKEFISDNPHWVIHEKYTNNNGLLILKRK